MVIPLANYSGIDELRKAITYGGLLHLPGELCCYLGFSDERDASLSLDGNAATHVPLVCNAQSVRLGDGIHRHDRDDLLSGGVTVINNLGSDSHGLSGAGRHDVVREARVSNVADGDGLKLVEEVKADVADQTNVAVLHAHTAQDAGSNGDLLHRDRVAEDLAHGRVCLSASSCEVEAVEGAAVLENPKFLDTVAVLELEDACIEPAFEFLRRFMSDLRFSLSLRVASFTYAGD